MDCTVDQRENHGVECHMNAQWLDREITLGNLNSNTQEIQKNERRKIAGSVREMMSVLIC